MARKAEEASDIDQLKNQVASLGERISVGEKTLKLFVRSPEFTNKLSELNSLRAKKIAVEERIKRLTIGEKFSTPGTLGVTTNRQQNYNLKQNYYGNY